MSRLTAMNDRRTASAPDATVAIPRMRPYARLVVAALMTLVAIAHRRVSDGAWKVPPDKAQVFTPESSPDPSTTYTCADRLFAYGLARGG